MLLTECSFWKIVHVAVKARIHQPVINSREIVLAKKNSMVRNVSLVLTDTMATLIVLVNLLFKTCHYGCYLTCINIDIQL